MTIKKIALLGIASFVAISFIVSSCKKKDKKEEEVDIETTSASDQSLASTTVNDMTNISDEAGRTLNVSSFRTVDANALLSNCASLTFDTMASAKTVTVNFGTTNCLCNDGRYRKGKIVLSFTGRYRDSLTVITVTPQSYFVNDNQIAGAKTITNKGRNTSGNLVYAINANLVISKANGGGTISFQSNREREWTTGSTTLTWNDDMYKITGTASGTTANGNSFSSNITTPLVRNMALACRRHFVSGVLEHTPAGKATRIINYGNGACDDQATVTINGTSYNVTLP